MVYESTMRMTFSCLLKYFWYESYNREAFIQEYNARLDVGVEIRLWMMRLLFVNFDKRARLLVAEFRSFVVLYCRRHFFVAFLFLNDEKHMLSASVSTNLQLLKEEEHPAVETTRDSD